MSFRRTEWPTNGPQLITLDSGKRGKYLIINQASEGIRTPDPITNLEGCGVPMLMSARETASA
jgi:hypothetical protein